MESQSEPQQSEIAKLRNAEYVQQKTEAVKAKEDAQYRADRLYEKTNQTSLATLEARNEEKIKEKIGKGATAGIIGFIIGILVFNPKSKSKGNSDELD